MLVYPEHMLRNLGITRGLIFSQTVMLMLVNKGLSREDSYKMVQTPAMDVWEDDSRNLKDELLKSDEIRKYLSKEEIEDIFDYNKMLKSVDFIFSRTVEKE